MIDVLMIALQFAPVQSTGAFRSIEFARRMDSHGIRLTVLTIEPEQAAGIFGGQVNPALAEGLPASVEVRFLRETKRPSSESKVARFWRMLSTLDDTFERRFSSALDAALSEFGEGPRRFAAVYASAPPFGATKLGMQAARTLGVPFVLDMRDAWAQWSPAPQTSRWHLARKLKDEAEVFAAADTIVSVTPELTALFADSHPSLPRERFQTVTNGMEDVAKFANEALWDGGGETVNIGYVGSFYWIPRKPASLMAPHRFLQVDPGTEDWSYRSPLPFFRAWAELDRQAPQIGAKIRFHHVGGTPDWLMQLASEFGVADRCICHGVQRRQEIGNFLDQMTGLLGTSMKRIDGKDYCLASKSFEYLASGKPTLAFVCEGAQKRFFEEVGGAVIFDPDQPKHCAEQLGGLIGKVQTLKIHKSRLVAYDHDATATQMAALIRQTAAKTTTLATPNAA